MTVTPLPSASMEPIKSHYHKMSFITLLMKVTCCAVKCLQKKWFQLNLSQCFYPSVFFSSCCSAGECTHNREELGNFDHLPRLLSGSFRNKQLGEFYISVAKFANILFQLFQKYLLLSPRSSMNWSNDCNLRKFSPFLKWNQCNMYYRVMLSPTISVDVAKTFDIFHDRYDLYSNIAHSKYRNFLRLST